MVSVKENEIKIGSVIYLDPEIIKNEGGCFVKCAKNQEVSGGHYFVVIDIVGSDCVCFPIYSEKNNIKDRVLLSEKNKSGKTEHWIGINSYFYKWQNWKFPLSSIEKASRDDNSDSGDRRFYSDVEPMKSAERVNTFEWREIA